jgi:ABC-2 type transport system ATP-binding protein
VLLTTHLLDEAERLADDVVIMRSGQVAATGTPAELTSAAAIEVLELRAGPGLDLTGLGPGWTAAEPAPGQYTISGTLNTAGLAEVLAWFASAGADVTAVNTRRRTLEDVYLSLTTTQTPVGATK